MEMNEDFPEDPLFFEDWLEAHKDYWLILIAKDGNLRKCKRWLPKEYTHSADWEFHHIDDGRLLFVFGKATDRLFLRATDGRVYQQKVSRLPDSPDVYYTSEFIDPNGKLVPSYRIGRIEQAYTQKKKKSIEEAETHDLKL